MKAKPRDRNATQPPDEYEDHDGEGDCDECLRPKRDLWQVFFGNPQADSPPAKWCTDCLCGIIRYRSQHGDRKVVLT